MATENSNTASERRPGHLGRRLWLLAKAVLVVAVVAGVVYWLRFTPVPVVGHEGLEADRVELILDRTPFTKIPRILASEVSSSNPVNSVGPVSTSSRYADRSVCACLRAAASARRRD